MSLLCRLSWFPGAVVQETVEISQLLLLRNRWLPVVLAAQGIFTALYTGTGPGVVSTGARPPELGASTGVYRQRHSCQVIRPHHNHHHHNHHNHHTGAICLKGNHLPRWSPGPHNQVHAPRVIWINMSSAPGPHHNHHNNNRLNEVAFPFCETRSRAQWSTCRCKANTLVPLVCGECAGCAHSGATNRWRSRWSWRRCNTIRTAPYGDRPQPPGPGEPGRERNFTATIRDPPTPQPELFNLFEEEPGGARPGSVTDPVPQERVQRHIAEQIIETFVPVRCSSAADGESGGGGAAEERHGDPGAGYRRAHDLS